MRNYRLIESDVKLCNCARCGETLLGLSMKKFDAAILPEKFTAMQHVASFVNDRPYCASCLPVVCPAVR